MTGEPGPGDLTKWARASFKDRVLGMFPGATVFRIDLDQNRYVCATPKGEILAETISPTRAWKEAYFFCTQGQKDS